MKPNTIKYKDYNEKYRKDNRDKLNQKSGEYYLANKDRVSKRNKERYDKMSSEEKKEFLSKIGSASIKYYNLYKERFFEMYGNRCECCGESIREFLSIEHKLGQAGKKKDTAMSAYKKASLKYQPKIYGILCHNCNQASKNGRMCPHKRNNQ